MPELPEAETIVRGLRASITGERIGGILIVHADVLRQPARTFRRRLTGARIEGVDRRGKNVLVLLDRGRVLAINLGMTGRPVPLPSATSEAPPTHPAVELDFESGARLVYDDVRRFGTVEALTSEEWSRRSERMGPEPLDPGYQPEALFRELKQSRAPVRSWLLDQRRIAGVGNIYANEALFGAGVHPARRARNVRRAEAYALHEQLRTILTSAIEAGGTTIRDYRSVDGDEGEYALRLRVYGREGEPCGACGSAIARVVLANRSAFYCPTCQRRR